MLLKRSQMIVLKLDYNSGNHQDHRTKWRRAIDRCESVGAPVTKAPLFFLGYLLDAALGRISPMEFTEYD
jgi:hypothetical protein